MRPNRIFYFVAALVFIVTTNKSLANTYSLFQAIEQARLQSPERKALLAQKESLLAKESQALAPSQPTFTFGVGDLAAQSGPDSSGLRTYQLTQGFGFPGKARTVAHSIELEASSITQDIQAKDVELSRIVKVAFFQFWLAEQKTALNQEKHSAFEKILEIAKRRSVKDTTSEVEYLTAESALKKVENERADIVASERSFQVSLNSLLGLMPETQTSVEAPQFSPKETAFNAQFLREQYLSSNLTLKSLKLRLEAANNRVGEAKEAYLPDFKLSAGANSYNAYAGTIELSLPLWFWWNERSGVKAASALYVAEQADYNAKEKALLSRFEEKLITLEALQAKLKNYNAFLMPNSKKAFNLALKNYRFGKIEFATLTGSAESLVSSRLEYATLLTEYEITRAETEEFLGGNLP